MLGDELVAEGAIYEKKLLNFFLRHGVSFDEGEDLVQETYLRLWKYRDRYEPSAKLSTFLFILARQVLIDAHRRTKRRKNPCTPGRLPTSARTPTNWGLTVRPRVWTAFSRRPHGKKGKCLWVPPLN